MKCWECKTKDIPQAIRVCYWDGEHEKTRDVCPDCEKKLGYNACHFVEVEKITKRQFISNLSAKELK